MKGWNETSQLTRGTRRHEIKTRAADNDTENKGRIEDRRNILFDGSRGELRGATELGGIDGDRGVSGPFEVARQLLVVGMFVVADVTPILYLPGSDIVPDMGGAGADVCEVANKELQMVEDVPRGHGVVQLPAWDRVEESVQSAVFGVGEDE
jgi:hypothetical protein